MTRNERRKMKKDRKKEIKKVVDANGKRMMVSSKILEIEYLWDIDGLETDAVNLAKMFGEKGVNDIDSLRYGVSELTNFLKEKYGLKGGDLLFVYYDFIARCMDYEKFIDPEIVEIAKNRVDDLKTFLRIFNPIVKEEAKVSN